MSPRKHKDKDAATSSKTDSTTCKKAPYSLSYQHLTDPTTTLKPLEPNLSDKQVAPPLKPPSEVPIGENLSQNLSLNLSQFPNIEFVSTTDLPNADSNFVDDYDWEDNRGDSPLRWIELLSGFESSDGEDPTYVPEINLGEDDNDLGEDIGRDKEKEGEFDFGSLDLEVEPTDELEGTDFIAPESDESDDELREARERVKSCNSKLFEVAVQLQKEASEGNLGEKPSSVPTTSEPGEEQPSQMASSSTPATVATATPSSAHHNTPVLPTALGKGGRMILGGQGAKSAGTGRGRGRGDTGSESGAATT
uniref:Uncharacterized protein n=1 Tax=Chenopodium quinoa TaxID=63459 RepID=A0A803LC24_CHEQI